MVPRHILRHNYNKRKGLYYLYGCILYVAEMSGITAIILGIICMYMALTYTIPVDQRRPTRSTVEAHAPEEIHRKLELTQEKAVAWTSKRIFQQHVRPLLRPSKSEVGKSIRVGRCVQTREGPAEATTATTNSDSICEGQRASPHKDSRRKAPVTTLTRARLARIQMDENRAYLSQLVSIT